MAHSNTIFAQVLQLVNRHEFQKIEKQGFAANRKYRKFSRWNQFSAMLFAQLSGSVSIRAIAEQFRFQARRLYHLGLKCVKRSTLSDANQKRSSDFFQAVFEHQYAKVRQLAPNNKFRFKNPLYSLDSSTIDLCLSLFPWASFRRTKSGIKLHTILDHNGYIPAFVQITEADKSDIKVARMLNLPPNSIVVMDRGYVDYEWFQELTNSRIFFVTRLKSNARYRVIKRHAAMKVKGITSDQIIELTGAKFKDKCIRLRRIGYSDPETGKHYYFLTNHFRLSAKTIADIYKDRWQVELFFKWIKQNLKIKSFLGNSKNAVMTQIWIALIAMLLLAYLKFKAKLESSLSRILLLIRLNLFEKRSVWTLYEKYKPDLTHDEKQLLLNFSNL